MLKLFAVSINIVPSPPLVTLRTMVLKSLDTYVAASTFSCFFAKPIGGVVAERVLYGHTKISVYF